MATLSAAHWRRGHTTSWFVTRRWYPLYPVQTPHSAIKILQLFKCKKESTVCTHRWLFSFVKIIKKIRFIIVNICIIQKFVVSLYCQTKRDREMKEKQIIMAVTEDEEELLAAIRNYNKSFPDGYPELLWYAQRLFDNMLRQPY